MSCRAAAVQAIVLSLVTAAAHSEEIPGAFKTNDDLRVICQDDSVYLDVCLGYLQGASDLLTVMQRPLWPFNYPYCLPQGAQAPDELRRVLMAYLDNHPEKSPVIGAGSAFRALIEAFPCPKQRAYVGPHAVPPPPF
jgi:hypothetical protein